MGVLNLLQESRNETLDQRRLLHLSDKPGQVRISWARESLGQQRSRGSTESG